MKTASRAALSLLVSYILLGLAACQATPSPTPRHTLPAEREAGFELQFEYWACYLHVLDTETGTFQRRVPGEFLEEVPLALTTAELDTIYQGLLAIDFMSYPERYGVPTPEDGIIAQVTPSYQYRLTIHSGAVAHTVAWIDDIVQPNPPEAEALRTLFKRMIQIIQAHPEFQELTAPTIGCI